MPTAFFIIFAEWEIKELGYLFNFVYSRFINSIFFIYLCSSFSFFYGDYDFFFMIRLNFRPKVGLFFNDFYLLLALLLVSKSSIKIELFATFSAFLNFIFSSNPLLFSKTFFSPSVGLETGVESFYSSKILITAFSFLKFFYICKLAIFTKAFLIWLLA